MIALVVVIVLLVLSLISAYYPSPPLQPGPVVFALWAIALILLLSVHA